MNEDREQERSDLGRLARLASRFAPEDFPDATGRGGLGLFDLRWWCDALAAAIRHVLSDQHPLFKLAVAARKDDALLIDVWRQVAQLPYEVVQEMIDYVHLQRGVWDIEDFVDGSADDESFGA